MRGRERGRKVVRPGRPSVTFEQRYISIYRLRCKASYLVRMIPSYFCWNHFMASSLVTWWQVPTLLLHLFLLATLFPGLSRTR